MYKLLMYTYFMLFVLKLIKIKCGYIMIKNELYNDK